MGECSLSTGLVESGQAPQKRHRVGAGGLVPHHPGLLGSAGAVQRQRDDHGPDIVEGSAQVQPHVFVHSGVHAGFDVRVT